MLSKIKTAAQSAKRSLSLAALSVATAVTTPVAFAQVGPQSPVDLLTANSTTFVADTKALLFAGAGLIIGSLLIKKLVELVINFFRRG